MPAEEHIQFIASIKVAGLSVFTFFSGLWAWFGENSTELGGLASALGIVSLLITIWRNRRNL